MNDNFRGPDTDKLLRDFSAGDHDAFQTIYQTYMRGMVQYGYKICPDIEVVKDCIQDLFVELWESREKVATIRDLRRYLFKSLRNKLFFSFREQMKKQLLEPMEEREDSMEAILIEDETKAFRLAQLEAALEKLPKRQQEALHLRYKLRLSNESIAEIMGLNYHSAYKLIYSGLKNLRLLVPYCSIWWLTNHYI
ncbi:MAG: hypothetical protein ABS46_19540 [Cytophagaceae bacterium SCN 52-12]|nr:MAG: hypothetical protein ABS46_19540 [Cytophagaceae bacterium SCN 52-12]